MRHIRQLVVPGAVCASVVAAGVLGAASANAEPAAPPIPRGMPAVVDTVLGPDDPGFWDPAVDGTRVLTPVEPGVRVACATGFEPVISCSTLDMRDLTSPQRTLAFIDVPTLGGPLRVWFDYPRWGGGSTAAVNEQLIERWQEKG
ncbi:MAG: hypothetical protein L0H20_03390 [Corynebacterium sp.]|uniref:hypothetical protein n=1 Tax=Corynebacterium sp. TaxID=1720 RepID=UPI00264999F8|nr:hypothetical protein [Corynebacterium sp.]MDN5722036.1 hypothetical protein [Corynebacterium sp.]